MRFQFKNELFYKSINLNSREGIANKDLIISHVISVQSSNLYPGKDIEQKIKTKKFDTAYSKLSEVKLVTIGVASPEKIRQWSEKTLPNGKVLGQVLNANTLHHKSFKPQKGGLFCERIFGPLKDFECACGKVQKPTKAQKEKLLPNSSLIPTLGIEARKYCPVCDVEYTWSVIRRYQLGYIQLVSPVTHIWYLKGNPSYLSILLDMKKRYLEYVTYCTESLTIENALKGNVSRLTNNPSEILAAWTKLVQKEKQNFKNSNALPGNEKMLKKQKLIKEKRLLKNPTRSKSWVFLMLNSSNSITDTSNFRIKKIQLKLLNSFIANEVSQSMKLDLNDQFSKYKLVQSEIKSLLPERSNNIYQKISLKRVFKTFPASFYLFFSLQTAIQKTFLKMLMSQTWTEIYFQGINKSFKNSYFFKIFINYLNYSSVDFNNQKQKNIIQLNQKSQNSEFSPEQILLLETLKVHWYKIYLILLNQFKSKHLINLSNSLVQNDQHMLQQTLDQNISSIITDLVPNSTDSKTKFNANYKLAIKVEHSSQNLLTGLELVSIQESIKKVINIISEFIFLYFIEEKNESKNFNTFGSKSNLNSMIQFIQIDSQPNSSVNDFKNISLENIISLKESANYLSEKILKELKIYELTLNELNTYLDFNVSGNQHDNLIVEKFSKIIQKQFSLLGEYQLNLISSTFFNNSKTRKIYPSIDFVSTSLYEIITPNFQLKAIKPSRTLLFTEEEPNLNQTKLVNNFYSVSHRERWIDAEWQNFVDYMSVPVPLISDSSGNSNSFLNLKQLPQTPKFNNLSLFSYYNYNFPITSEELKIIPNYKHRMFNLNLDPILAPSGKNPESNNNFSYFSGPGIIQQLLKELNFSEQRKMDKQNRILLYQLNNHIFMLKKQIYKKFAKKELKECYKFRDQLIRRTKLIRTFFRKDSNPDSMIITILPVIPPDLRPIVKIGGQIAASDLNRLYQRVIYRNDRLKKFLKDPATSSSYEMKYAQRLLQESVDNLIQNGKSGVASEKDARGRALKSLSDLLKGKQGRFRQYLLGKRVDYSGRSVIVVGPKLKLHECGLPKEMALELYLPFLLKRILNYNYARTVVGAKTLIRKNPELTWELLKEIMQTCPVLLNRAPTLHRLGIQAFQPKLIEGRAILLHPLVCPAFNADFDGDQMAVHIPITVEARSEAWKLMCARNNFLAPSTGEPLAIPSQDMVLGCYYLTTNCNKSNIKLQRGTGLAFSNFADVLNAYHRQIIDLHALVWVKFEGHLEQGNDKDQPLEIRINSFGDWNEIYQFNLRKYSKNNGLINQYICTTPGRMLFNFIIQQNNYSTLFH